MTLQFILGTADKDHAQALTERLLRMLQEHPNDQYFYLVPNHIKFESEVKTLERLNLHHDDVYAQTNVQIFSLTRLAWFFLNREPAYQIPRLSAAGINMLLYQIIEDHQSELTVFKSERGHPGFISQLASQILEMAAGRISAADLSALYTTNQTALNSTLRDKLHDFNIIYTAFEAATDGQFIHPNDPLQLLCDYLLAHDLSQMHFLISGFSQLNAQERNLVMILMQRAADVTIDLNLDRPAGVQQSDAPNLFYQPAHLYHQLYQFARANRIPVMTDQYATTQRVNNDLLALNNYWIQSTNLGPIDTFQLVDPQSIQVVKADNYYAELVAVAIQIRQLVASGRYHYRDILVLTRHLNKYQNIIDPVFKLQQIPYFNDVQKSMVDHPLVQLIDALFKLVPVKGQRSYRYEDVMRLLKTELLIPKDAEGHYLSLAHFRDVLAQTENVVLKNGYTGNQWTQAADWQTSRGSGNSSGPLNKSQQQLDQRVNLIRHYVKRILPPFFKRLQRAPDMATWARELYQFLVDQGVVEQLQRWRDRSVDAGDLAQAAQPEQVWQTFCDLLDSFVSLLGDREASDLTAFWELLKAGFEGANYSQIPSTLDQVTISESGIVQMTDYRIVFMIGATDDVMPDQITNENLFNDSDRDDLTQYFNADQYIRDNSEAQMANDPYLNYLAFLTGSERLIFSYCLANDSDSETGVQLSPYVARIMQHFGITERHYAEQPQADATAILPYVGTDRMTLHHLVQASYDYQYHHHSLSAAWQLVYQKLTKHSGPLRTLTEKLLGGLDYRNQPATLTPANVIQLYGNSLQVSVSQLEQYYQNPYEYFLRYGLRLHERERFELTPAHTGEFYHAVLDQFVKRLQQQGVDLLNVDFSVIGKEIDDVITNLLNDENQFQYAVLNQDTNRMRYLRNQLTQTVKRMAYTMQQQEALTAMRPDRTEVLFRGAGSNDELEALQIDLPNKQKIAVRGRIDRIDKFVDQNGQPYLNLIDYKSSKREIDFGQFYAGTSLQLFTYLKVINENGDLFKVHGKEAKIAGALYEHVFNPKLTAADLQKQGDKAMLKKLRYQGLLVDDNGDLLNQFPELNSGDESLLYPLKLKKDHTFDRHSKVVSPGELETILNYTESLIYQAGIGILGGNIALRPVKENNQTALQYSPYQSIMQFDPLLNENNYRMIEKISLEQLLKLINAKGAPKDGLH